MEQLRLREDMPAPAAIMTLAAISAFLHVPAGRHSDVVARNP